MFKFNNKNIKKVSEFGLIIQIFAGIKELFTYFNKSSNNFLELSSTFPSLHLLAQSEQQKH